MKRLMLAGLAVLIMGAGPAPMTLKMTSAETPASEKASPTPAEVRAIQERVERLDREAAAARQEQREINDLAAQQAMVRLSGWQVILAAITTVVAAASIGFTATALWQTRTSLKLARNTAQAQLRAYLSLSEFEARGFPEAAHPSWRWKLTNLGVTPATAIGVWLDYEIVDGTPNSVHLTRPPGEMTFWGDYQLGPSQHQGIVAEGNEELSATDSAALVAGEKSIAFAFVIRFTDCFDQVHEFVHSEIRRGVGLRTNEHNSGFR